MPSPSLISPLLCYRTLAKASAQSLFCCQVRDLVWNTCFLYLDTQIKAETYPGFRSLFRSLSSFDVVWFIIDRHEFNVALTLAWWYFIRCDQSQTLDAKDIPFRTARLFHLFSAHLLWLVSGWASTLMSHVQYADAGRIHRNIRAMKY